MKQSNTISFNLMNDPHIYRGSNIEHAYEYHAQISATQIMQPKQYTNEVDTKYHAHNRKQQRKELEAAYKIRPIPPTVESLHKSIIPPKIRQRIPLDQFLTENVEKPAMINLSTQTDYFQKHPKEVTFLPAKTGIDLGIQVETDDLFDLSSATLDLAALIVQNVSEQSLMEVRQEEELKWLLKRQKEMKQKALEEQLHAEALIAKQRLDVEEHQKALERAREFMEEEILCSKRILALKNSLAMAKVLNEVSLCKVNLDEYSNKDNKTSSSQKTSISILKEILPSLNAHALNQKSESAAIVDAILTGSTKR